MAERDGKAAGARLIAVGTEFAITIVAGVAIGYKVDQYCGSEPWLMLLFTLAAFYGAMRRLLWAIKRNS